MATETTYWGIIHLNSEQKEKADVIISGLDNNSPMINNLDCSFSVGRGYSLHFGKVVRGGYDEKDFWINEFENFLKKISGIYAIVCFEFEDKKGMVIYQYYFNGEYWIAYENYLETEETNERALVW
jgi:hypothetical protein